MKTIILSIALFVTINANAAYLCEGPKDTALASFAIHEISMDSLDTELDGTLDFAGELNKDTIEYIYNNGCDNNIALRVNKIIFESLPHAFNMRVDYFGPDDLLTDTEVICRKSGN